VTIPFAGDAVYLYGPAGAFGQMSVTVDGRNKTEVNCTSSVAQSKALLVRCFHLNYGSLIDVTFAVLLGWLSIG